METSRPARPHLRLTDEGRRVREVLSYSQRGSRLSEREQDAWDRLAPSWVIPEEAVDEPGFRLTDWFDRRAPLVVEVGCGAGESLALMAAARPDLDVLAFEVWRPGVASALWRLEEAGADNVRLVGVDAVWSMRHLVPVGSVTELWTFFPDPWPKTRHHKRRLVQPGFARDAARALVDGGAWRLATDWAAYAEQMQAVLDAEPELVGGVSDRWAPRPVTRFEGRGTEAGRAVTDLTYRRQDRGPHQPGLVGQHHRLHPVAHPELHQQPLNVGRDGVLADEERPGVLGVGRCANSSISRRFTDGATSVPLGAGGCSGCGPHPARGPVALGRLSAVPASTDQSRK